MKMQRLITGLIGSALIVFPSAALAENQTSNGINTSGSPALVIDNIVCKGNDTTECDFITKKYYQDKGDVLDPSEIADAKLRLGTLIQFRDVDIHLEKGHKRGHVIVVFNITEASNIQYELGAGFSYNNRNSDAGICFSGPTSSHLGCIRQKGHSNNLGLSSSITDFNFLGLGKRLSVGLSGSKFNSTRTVDYQSSNIPDLFGSLQSNTHDSDGQSINVNIDYFDPHLFDSSHYYLRTNVARTSNNQNSNSVEHRESSDGNVDVINGSDVRNESSSMGWNVEIGRRFASHSFISINANKSFNSQISVRIKDDSTSFDFTGPDRDQFGISYGWDSQDDTLFPTQGSVFTTNYRYNDSPAKYQNLSMNYLRHLRLTEQTILTLGGSIAASEVKIGGFDGDSGQTVVNTGLSARLTRINPIDLSNGIYSGWHTSLNLDRVNGQPSASEDLSLNLKAGYTLQTDSMIYRFTLGYSAQEKI